MSLQPDSEHSGSQQTALPPGFAGKPPSSHGPKTVINPERRMMPADDNYDLPPMSYAKRRRLFPGDDTGSGEGSASGQAALGPAGVELAHFLIEEPIGRGGMGSVYRALDQSLERVVALKVLSPDQSQSQNSVQRFVNEARASARLDHDNIARVYYVGEDDGLHFIAYEYVTGTNIRDLIQHRGRLDPAEAINYTLQVAAALKHTSAAGVVHRDVKPSNIIVTPVGRAKLVDLGLARKEYTESVDELTVAGTTLGTFDYISPEQAKDPRNVDVRSDIYSLGCTLYQMLTGEPPYPEGTMYQKLLKHDGKEPPDPALKNRRVPPELSAVVKRMMASDPGRRHRDADDLIRDLMNVAGLLGIRTVSPDGLVWSAEMTERKPGFLRRNLGWMATAAALVLIVVLLDRFGEKLNIGGSEPAPPGNVAAHSGTPDSTAGLVNPVDGNAAERNTTDDAGPRTPVPYQSQADGPPDQKNSTPAVIPLELPGNLTPDASIGTVATTKPGSEKPATNGSGTSGEAIASNTNTSTSGDGNTKPAVTVPVEPMPPTTIVQDPPTTFPPAENPPPQIMLTGAGGADSKSYNTVEAACQEAVDGSVIVLRYNGRRAEAEKKPLRLIEKRITIRGEKGFRPVIEFRPVHDATGEPATRLFTLIGGYATGYATSVELINVDIHVVLPENANPALDWALFSLQGSEQLRLTDVHVTFENEGGRYPASVIELTTGPTATLSDMKMMKEKPGGARSEFEIKLSGVFVRGGCDLIHVSQTRPGRVTLEQSGLAIDGTLLSVVGDLEMPDETSDFELQIEHVTAFLGNGLIHWNTGGDPREVLPVQVTSRNNIYSTNSDRPLISMEGNTDPADFRKLLRWSGERNYYDRFGMLWTISSDMQTIDTVPFDFARWANTWAGTELDPHGEPVIWQSAWWKKQLVNAAVDDLRLDGESDSNPAVGGANGSDAGVDLTKLRPTFPLDAAKTAAALETAGE